MQQLIKNQNKKNEEKIKELQDFISRFSANKSKSKQATARRKLLDKLTVEEMPASSRRYPWVGFSPDREVGKDILFVTDVSKTIDEMCIRDRDQWVQMDTALVNIGNYPSSPDFASLVRYGSLLQQQHTCGRLLVYYFNEAGTVIQSDQDFAIQIPLELLKQCPHIVGVCSANTSEKALRGALRSGIFTHIAARAELVKSLLDQ